MGADPRLLVTLVSKNVYADGNLRIEDILCKVLQFENLTT